MSYRVEEALESELRLIVRISVSKNASGDITSSCNGVKGKKCDNEYRVVFGYPRSVEFRLPTSENSWKLEYIFDCPPLPSRETFHKSKQTFYVWGDLSFGSYDQSAKALHPYKMNQIVPQVMCGRCLADNDGKFMPNWLEFDSWVIQVSRFY